MSQAEAVQAFIEKQAPRYLEELTEYLRIPSISSSSPHKQEVARCAQFTAERLRDIGLHRVEVMPTGGHPIVYGEWLGAPGKPTVLVYGHYDVQPVDPLDLWVTPPFEPSVRGDELFARGAADDKGQVYMHIAAAEAHLKVTGGLPVNLKFLIEGEEEIASPNLDSFVISHRDLLRADVGVISDTPMLDKEHPSICYGLRGLVYLEVDVVGPKLDLHSGIFGGNVANPVHVLAEVLARLKDAQGRVTIPGFYDDVRALDPRERAQLAALPFDPERYRHEIGVPALFGEPDYMPLERVWARPTLDVNGIWGGYSGEGSKTIIPAKAGAKLSCRLVPDQRPEVVGPLVRDHILSLCPNTVAMEARVTNEAKPCLTPLDHPAVGAAARAVEKGFGKRPVFIREGGTIPFVATLMEQLQIPCILLGVGLPDENAHAPNEHFHLPNFYGGIRTVAHLWEELAALS